MRQLVDITCVAEILRLKSNTRNRQLYLDTHLASLAWSFTGQSALKHVLTEGDKMLLSAFQISEEQKGAYKLVSDLGKVNSFLGKFAMSHLRLPGMSRFFDGTYSISTTGGNGTCVLRQNSYLAR